MRVIGAFDTNHVRARNGPSSDGGAAHILQIILLPLLVASAIIGWQVSQIGPNPFPNDDEIAYLSISRTLYRTGVFTDGTFSPIGKEDAPGRFFTPAYPGFITLISVFDSGLASAIECYGGQGKQCEPTFARLVVAQLVLAAITGLLIFLISWRVSDSEAVGWIAMISALATGEFGYYPTRYLTETLSFTVLFAFLYLTVRSYLDLDRNVALFAGLAIGVASLTRPIYLYLFYFMCCVIPIAFYLGRGASMRHAFSFAACLIAGGTAVILPWCVRNVYYFGHFALSEGYAELSLVQRLGYDAMAWKEVGVAAIAWLPGIGQPLVKLMFAPELYARLGTSLFRNSEPLYVFRGDLFERTLAAAGSPEGHMKFLIWNNILGDLPKHLVVTLLMTMRGLWVGKYLAVAGMACLIPAIWLMRKQGRATAFALFLLPLVFLSLLYGFVSVSVFRYHVPMIGAYALAVALTGSAIFLSIRKAAGRGSTLQ